MTGDSIAGDEEDATKLPKRERKEDGGSSKWLHVPAKESVRIVQAE